MFFKIKKSNRNSKKTEWPTLSVGGYGICHGDWTLSAILNLCRETMVEWHV
jgi:hypothetical protein